MGNLPGSRPDREGWIRVSKSQPCPVCKKPDWCMVAPDGNAAICQRVEKGSTKPCGDGGWLHRLTRASTRPGPQGARKGRTVTTDWTALAGRRAAELNPARRNDLARTLGLPADALDALPLLGFHNDARGAYYTFPEANAGGTVVGLNRRFADGTKKALPGSKRGLTLPAGWRERPGPVFVVEGPTDAAAMTAAGLSAVGRPSNTGGVAHLAELFGDLDAGRSVVVVGENDRKASGEWPGRTGAESVARGLAGRLGRAVQWALPPEGAKDVREWLTASAPGETPWPDRGVELGRRLVAAAVGIDPPPTTTADGSRSAVPDIVIGPDEHRVNAEATAALAAEEDVYQRGGLLVHVLHQSDDSDLDAVVRRPVGAPVVRELARPLLRERLTRVARWTQWRGAGENAELVEAHPTDWCVGAVHARGDWPGLRRLDAVVTHPVLLPSGDLLTANGYHRGVRLLAALPADLAVTVPDAPTRQDVDAAVAALLDPLADFPFETPAHRAALVAGLLTPLAWFLFDGPAPLFLIDGNVRGVGKGLLADVVALTVTGRRFPVMSYTNDREELRKKITTLAMECERLVLLDNLAGAVGNDILDAALTTDRWKDRVLGGNRVYDGPLHVVWFGTGNNVQLGADTSRRVCHARMESADERPEMKEGFRHPDLRGYVRRDRGRLLSAALTILRAWVRAGRPRHQLRPWGSFEGWSGVVREAVVFAGLPDPGETRVALQTTADRDAAAMADVIAGLIHLDDTGRGLTTADIVGRIKEAEREAPAEWMSNLRAAVEDLCGKLCGRTLGYRFRHFARRNFGGKVLDKADAPHGSNRWVVRDVKGRAGREHVHHAHHHHPDPRPAGGDGGDGGDDSARPAAVEAALPRSRTRFVNDDTPHDVRG
ncbi:hypothetical protein [Urbifossiella limnaea]|uniref:Toprim domain-containing protein n=1 Tax=Urbifossiella limnaea TaxID=2528023 RepID=A0A517Y1G4_9BACT|nr:hypothetical protein [Urbifossiella limnaea]QDU23585.1 hypothetical protein ETAA1_55870 [Urbifossiella limnaea]